jgi:hypothetical protein
VSWAGIVFSMCAVAIEAFAAIELLSLPNPYASTVVLAVAGAQAAPVLLALLGASALWAIQCLAARRARKAQLPVTDLTQVTPRELELVILVQRVYRGYHGRMRAARKRELDTWHSMSSTRRVLLVILYSIAFTLVAMSLYITLIFGVKFTPVQVQAWLTASLMTYLLDAFVKEPLIALLKTAGGMILRVLKNGPTAVSEYLVRSAQLRLTEARRHAARETASDDADDADEPPRGAGDEHGVPMRMHLRAVDVLLPAAHRAKWAKTLQHAPAKAATAGVKS